MYRDKLDEHSLHRRLQRLVDNQITRIAPPGSTGHYAYLDWQQKQRVLQITADYTKQGELLAGIGAISTSLSDKCLSSLTTTTAHFKTHR